jgi:aminoglycoside/choline kinase family phosphotransferase
MAHDVLSESELRRRLEACGRAVRSLTRLTGDVSLRVYFRAELEAGETAILAAYPIGVGAGCHRFRTTTALLEEIDVRVPRILAVDCAAGWTLLEDLGEETLYEPSRSWAELLPYIERAAGYIARIATLPPQSVVALSPPLDEALLRRELDQTWELCLAPRGLTGDAGLERRLRRALSDICATLGRFEPCPNHRDFMARNLVPVGDPPGLAVLDHQDLRMGPPRYDLASLLNDSVFPPAEIEERLLARWAPSAEDRRHYHLAAVQRTLKACGTYEAFARRGNPRHLSLVGPTLGRALLHLASQPGTAELAADLERLWRPLVDGGAVRPIC